MTKTFVTGEVLTASDVNTYLVNNGYQYAGTRYYTSSGTFAKADPLGTGDIGLRAIRVRVQGGGGGGAGVIGINSVGGGGGGGGYAESFITDIAGLASSVTVTRGSGGAGGTTGDGVAGGASSFGTAVIGNGGNIGYNSNSHQRGQGASGTGDLVIRGGDGEVSCRLRLPGAMGGASHLGGSIAGRFDNASVFTAAGIDGVLYGGGGSGAANWGQSPGAGDSPGGAGADGIVIIDCYV